MNPGGNFDSDSIERKIKALEQESGEAGFWDDRENAEKKLGDLKKLHRRYDPWKELLSKFDDLDTLLELSMEEKDETQAAELEKQLKKIRKRYEELHLLELFQGDFDDGNAFLTIHSGAGGTEACDWTTMLLRMYSRWAENRNFTLETLDLQEAEGGVKSVTLQVNGDYAFGYLKSEIGVHRLVRMSPFDSSGRRHTSFASVYLSPVIEDDIEVDIKPMRFGWIHTGLRGQGGNMLTPPIRRSG